MVLLYSYALYTISYVGKFYRKSVFAKIANFSIHKRMVHIIKYVQIVVHDDQYIAVW